MQTLKRWLVLRNGEDLRVVKKNPAKDLLPNEIAFEINLSVPMPPKIAGVINIELPEPPPIDAAEITVEEWITYTRAEERAAAVREKLGDDQ